MKIHTVQEIFNHLENCIEYKKPFSHIRFGDGGIKLLHCLLYDDKQQLIDICKKEGLPFDKIIDIVELWGYYARKADYIDTPIVYYNDTFWPRYKKKSKKINEFTEQRMLMWKELYDRFEFDNVSYCNPESNCLMIINIPDRKTILDIMKNRKVCVITAKPELVNIIPNIDIVPIVGHYENQYKNSFKYTMNFIKNRATDYDLFLVAAGELGRIYSGYIKDCGGRSIDIGFVAEYWVDGFIHPRFFNFLKQPCNNRLKLVLTDEGKKYEQYI